jgi:hypothetical protein
VKLPLSWLPSAAAACAFTLGAATAQEAPRAPPSDAAFSQGLQMMMQQAEDRIAAANSTAELRGSGPYPAMMEVDLAFPDATIYRPAALSSLGSSKLGVVIWGNGGCANDGASARAHLSEIASHGYLVIAPGKPLTGPTVSPGAATPLPMTTSIQDMRVALEWALAENGRAGSPYFRRINPASVATSGHSCGGMLAIMLADDPRVRAVIIHNSGIFPVLPDNPPLVMHSERLQGLRTPALFILGGRSDVAWGFAEQAYAKLSNVPVFFGSLDVGHGGTFAEPHGGAAARVAVDWLEWQLRQDAGAGRTFLGRGCRLCTDPKWTVRKKGIP